LLLYADELGAIVDEVRGDLPALRHVFSLDRDVQPLLARASDAEPAVETALTEHDPHVMLYTSGTTGDPKGALLSHRAYVLQATQTPRPTGLGEDDVALCMFPMFHMGGWAMPLGYWANGASVVIMERADPGEILRAVARERVTYLYLIPTLFDALLSLPDLDRAEVSSLRALGSGTSVMTEAQARTIVDRFRNPNLSIMYGQTEAGPVATLRPPDVLRKPTSVGRPVPHVDARVVDADGADVAPGETGEIVCRSEYAMLGYWRMPEATAEAFRGGWLHTGALAALDDDGFRHARG